MSISFIVDIYDNSSKMPYMYSRDGSLLIDKRSDIIALLIIRNFLFNLSVNILATKLRFSFSISLILILYFVYFVMKIYSIIILGLGFGSESSRYLLS